MKISVYKYVEYSSYPASSDIRLSPRHRNQKRQRYIVKIDVDVAQHVTVIQPPGLMNIITIVVSAQCDPTDGAAVS